MIPETSWHLRCKLLQIVTVVIKDGAEIPWGAERTGKCGLVVEHGNGKRIQRHAWTRRGLEGSAKRLVRR